jgi:alkaline phosphatase
MHHQTTHVMRKAVSFFLLLIFSIFSQGLFAQRADSSKAKNVILMIGDGMGVAQIYAGLTANKGWLNLERFHSIGFSKTNSANRYITESAAGATAISTGVKTHNHAIGVDSSDNPLPTILEIAEKNGLSTGLIATTSITDATPAAFTAHVPERDMQDEIALGFLQSGVDIFIGGGKSHFTKRKDGRDLTVDLRKQGFKVLDNIDDIVQTTSGKIAGFVSDQPKSKGRGDQLKKASLAAIKILSQNNKGFFLMIEGSQIDDGGHENNIQHLTDEMIDFDQTIGAVLDFAAQDGNTLVIVTADHETGGLTLTGGDLRAGKVEAKFSTEDHTSVMVPVFAFGPGAEQFQGIYHNNTIFQKMMDAYRFTK